MTTTPNEPVRDEDMQTTGAGGTGPDTDADGTDGDAKDGTDGDVKEAGDSDGSDSDDSDSDDSDSSDR